LAGGTRATAQNAINIDLHASNGGGPGANLNVGTYAGRAVPATGTHWNGRSYTSGYSGVLNNDLGAGTAVNLYLNDTFPGWSYNVGGAGLDVNAEALMCDYPYINNTTDKFFSLFTTFQSPANGLKLEPGSVWDIYIYSSGDSAGQGSSFTLKQPSGSITLSTNGAGPWNGTFAAGASYVKFSNVTPTYYSLGNTSSADHGYEFAFNWGAAGFGAINGIQLVRVSPGPSAYSVPANMQWWADARFGMFIHFGSYSRLGRGEWAMFNDGYSKQNYHEQVTKPFNPTNFNATDIVNLAKAAGQKYIVITAKHHEGFAMWNRTAATSFKDYTGTTIYSLPGYTNVRFSRDLLMELKNACDAQGLKFCLYYSIMDWSHPSQTMNSWFPALTTMSSLSARTAYIADMKAELNELITRYNPAILWFDGDWFGEPASPTVQDWWLSSDGQDLYNFVKSKSSTVIVNERVKRDFGLGDYSVSEFGIPSMPMSRSWEACATMNGAWGYDTSRETSSSYRPAKEMIQEWVSCVSRDGNYLLNIGPDQDGDVSSNARSRLTSIASWSSIWSGSLYGVTRNPFDADPAWGRFTKKSGFLYCHVFNWPTNRVLSVPQISNPISKIYVLNKPGTLLTYTISGGNINISVPAKNPDATGTNAVVVIECTGVPSP
jgi:alpha-L-fucosidase